LSNPIDLTGSAVDEDFVAAASLLSRMQEVDCLLILLLPYLPGITSDLGARLSQIHRQTGKPMISYVPHVEKFLMFVEGFQLNQIPVAHSIEEAVHMAKALKRSPPR
jgi:acetyltransferase